MYMNCKYENVLNILENHMFPTKSILLARHLVSVCVSLVRVCIFPGMTIINQKYSFYITVRRVNVHEVNVMGK